MIDIRLLRDDFEETCKRIRSRGKKYEQLDQFKEVDTKYRQLTTEIQNLNSKRNDLSKQIGSLIKDPSKKADVEHIQNEVKDLKSKIDQLTNDASVYEKKLNDIMLSIPNIPDKSVVIGVDEKDNPEQHRWGEPTKFDFTPKAHWDLGVSLYLFDLERSVRLCGSRYVIYTGKGAKLIRALQNYTVDFNITNGFYELLPPVLVKSEALYGTGQLPKFAEDLYKMQEDNWLSPTGEVQMTNFHSGEILELKDLPKRFTCDTACFRSEAGSAGKDIKGVIRQHQFYKTEMVILCKHEDSWNEHEMMTRNAEKILESLNLPYRRILLCTGDMGFGSAKTYDIEVWLPSYNAYKEISSCSNCLDFQARNMLLRYKDENKKTQYCHTLNGSGLAIDRLWAAVVENYQQKDGSILIPEPLRKYFNGEKYIK
ncbi:MAG: serine--tRNA ligase [Malacoplasma sp.]|nr:serine--tRNA ligase [Malacoplasma sp.]